MHASHLLNFIYLPFSRYYIVVYHLVPVYIYIGIRRYIIFKILYTYRRLLKTLEAISFASASKVNTCVFALLSWGSLKGRYRDSESLMRLLA